MTTRQVLIHVPRRALPGVTESTGRYFMAELINERLFKITPDKGRPVYVASGTRGIRIVRRTGS